MADLFLEFGEFKELTAGVLNALIDRITVSEPYVKDGRYKQDLTIYYRYIGAIEVVQHDSTRIYKSDNCDHVSGKRTPRRSLDQRVTATKKETDKEQDEPPSEKTA